MSSCGDSCCTSCRAASSASAFSVFWPTAAGPVCCLCASSSSPRESTAASLLRPTLRLRRHGGFVRSAPRRCGWSNDSRPQAYLQLRAVMDLDLIHLRANPFLATHYRASARTGEVCLAVRWPLPTAIRWLNHNAISQSESASYLPQPLLTHASALETPPLQTENAIQIP